MRDFLIYRALPFVGFVAVNLSAVYCLVTGKMIGRFGTIVEGRHSGPILYWIYMSFLLAGTLILNVSVAKMIISDNPRKRSPNQSSEPTPASGTSPAVQEPRHP